jgi:hypothetical protein
LIAVGAGNHWAKRMFDAENTPKEALGAVKFCVLVLQMPGEVQGHLKVNFRVNFWYL